VVCLFRELCANECGYLDIGVLPKFSSCSVGIQWFKERGQWEDNSYIPKPGDLIFFDWDVKGVGQDGAADHVGIVERVDGDVIYTVEGNTSDSCAERSYAVGWYEAYGFGVLCL
jgi:hypothetical protein